MGRARLRRGCAMRCALALLHARRRAASNTLLREHSPERLVNARPTTHALRSPHPNPRTPHAPVSYTHLRAHETLMNL
eukprot:2488140-Prymnesium_polylepis.1